ncbi:GSCOCG00004723001-RA-CDS [Cotesia congregata]|uniref:Similar to Igbp1b: Immunoglobulin-binding protein 1b (Mus musculus) n=1 Tax=Cotesia congregata TaxID=51543 RepID=A0A8J2MKQ2_COTCN|nr:GSCOCG00004723001-RA-CDS [Cotesia congregata]CAG5092118.1 Similar to Igbp1b: Immunoglobulin-binding protein 1b (Mus musculus) [Cotesia congregata]
MASAESEENLSDLFDSGYKLFTSIQNTQSATNSLEVQLDVKKCISIFETATKLVSIADMFSRNEEFTEVPTENIKYFLLPAFLGTLASKICDRENRMHYLKVSEVYFYDFLERIKSYGVINFEIPKKDQEDDDNDKKEGDKKKTSNLEKIEDMVSIRKLKLMRYKEQKDLKEKLEVYQKSMDNPNLDDETKRNYFTTLINLYALEAVDEINSLKEEKAILEQMKMISSGKLEDKKKDNYKPPKLQPIIITKNQLQKQVMGAGYPSLPVMTVEEFYEKKIADGEWAAPGTNVGGKSLQDMAESQGQEDPEVLEKEKLAEKDDEEYLNRMRAMDEYKDTHKRGWGNRYNRS